MSVCLYDCLYEAKLDQYYPQLKSAGIVNSEALSMLTMEDYMQFGVYKMEDRKRLFQLIQIIKNVHRTNSKHSFDVSNSSPLSKNDRQSGKISQKELSETLPMTPERGRNGIARVPSQTPKESPTTPQLKGFVTPKRSKSLPFTRKSKKNISPKTLSKLEKTGGVLFISQSVNNNLKVNDFRKKASSIRRSVSDSELFDDSVVPTNSAVNIAQLKKQNYVGKVDHNTGYNYGVLDGNEQSPTRKNVSKQNKVFNTLVFHETQLKSLVGMPKIIVCVRKRPVSRRELQNNEVNVVEVPSQSSVIINEVKTNLNLSKFVQEHKFHFDEVFHESSSNEEVYNRTARPLLQTVFNKGKATCFAYGQTGAGKTHTMMGTDKVKGLYLLAAHDIFQQQQSGDLGSDVAIWTSYFEIYCGHLYDLLNNRQRLHAREDAHHRVNIVGLKEVHVLSADGLLQVVEHGNRIRSKGCSGVNSSSSRSHAVLQIELKDPSKRPIGRLSFIDLAGSERACDTVDPDKITRIEGAEINTSLLALKECIRALDQDQKHTPFRQSKLTQVLKDSFIGNSRTCMIANVSPNISSTEHTLNTLRYADRVKELRKEPLRNGNTPKTITKLRLHPPTPTTFTPGTTSTPMKSSKNIVTPKSQPGVTKHVLDDPCNLRINVQDKNHYTTPQKYEGTRNGESRVSSNKIHRSNRISQDSKRDLFNTSTSSKGKDMSQKSFSILTDKEHPHSITSRKSTLPVWQPIVNEEPEIPRTPDQRNKAWDVENERYLLKSNGHRTDENSAITNEEIKKESYDEVRQSSIGNGKWYVRNNSGKIKEVMSSSRRSGKQETKALLAEIDESLKTSFVRLSPELTDQLYSVRLENKEITRVGKEKKNENNDLLLTSPIVLRQKSLMSLGEIVQSSFDSVSTDSLTRHPIKSHDFNANVAHSRGVDLSNYSPEGRNKKTNHSQMYLASAPEDKASNSENKNKKDMENLPFSAEQGNEQSIAKAEGNSSEREKHHQLTHANTFPTPSNYRSLRTGTLSARKLDFAMEVLSKAMNPVKKDSVKLTTFAEQRMKSSLWKSFQTFSETKEEPQLHQSQSNGNSIEQTKEDSQQHPVVNNSTIQAEDTTLSRQSPPDQSLKAISSEVKGKESTACKQPLPKYQSTPIVKECFSSKSYQHLMDRHINSPIVQEKVSLEDISSVSNFASKQKHYGKDATETTKSEITEIKTVKEMRQDTSNGINSTEFVSKETKRNLSEGRTSITPHRSKHLRSKSAVEKAQNLLFLTHSQQLQEIRSLCDREVDLLNEVKKGNLGFYEYLTLTRALQETKLHRIQTFKEQMEAFNNFSSPEMSPSDTIDSSFH